MRVHVSELLLLGVRVRKYMSTYVSMCAYVCGASNKEASNETVKAFEYLLLFIISQRHSHVFYLYQYIM